MKYLSFALIFLLCGVSGAEVIIRKTDGAKEYAKWKCTKNGFIAYTDQERDQYISKVSKGSAPLTTSDFDSISPSKEERDDDAVKSKSLDEVIKDLVRRIETLEAK
jgi:hypothetical protein